MKTKQEKDLRTFEEHCQNIGVQVHKATKEAQDRIWHEEDIEDITYYVMNDSPDVFNAVKALVNHSLKMMDK